MSNDSIKSNSEGYRQLWYVLRNALPWFDYSRNTFFGNSLIHDINRIDIIHFERAD